MDADHDGIRKPDFDRWLDAALRARAEAEPRMLLEERVLARLASEPRRIAAWWPTIAAVAALMAIAIAVVLLHPSRPERTTANRAAEARNAVAANRAPVQKNSASPVAAIHEPRDRHVLGNGELRFNRLSRPVAYRHSPRRLPKLASFPADHPATQEERMLAHLAAHLTAEKQFSEIAKLSIDSPPRDLSIRELRIEPLENTPADSNPQK